MSATAPTKIPRSRFRNTAVTDPDPKHYLATVTLNNNKTDYLKITIIYDPNKEKIVSFTKFFLVFGSVSAF